MSPGREALNFLYAVMRDPTAPLEARIRAAGELMWLEPDGPPTPAYTLNIGTLFAGPNGHELMQDLLYVKRCYELGIMPDLDNVTPKGRA
jgi:hypothetical protein